MFRERERRIDLLLPPPYPVKKGGGRIPRSPALQMAPMREFVVLAEAALSSEERLIQSLKERYSYSESLLWLRAFQWMGLLDPSESSPPFVAGLRNLELKPMPLLNLLRNSRCPAELKPCLIPLLSLLLPNPFRSIMIFSLSSKSVEEVAEKLMEQGSAAERLIALQHVRSGGKGTTDLIFLLRLLFSAAIVRRGKKSDEGKRIAYLREQLRGEWRSHPCTGYSPLLGADLIEAESFVAGKIDGLYAERVPNEIYLASRLRDDSRECLTELLRKVKINMPAMVSKYEKYYEFKPSS